MAVRQPASNDLSRRMSIARSGCCLRICEKWSPDTWRSHLRGDCRYAWYRRAHSEVSTQSHPRPAQRVTDFAAISRSRIIRGQWLWNIWADIPQAVSVLEDAIPDTWVDSNLAVCVCKTLMKRKASPIQVLCRPQRFRRKLIVPVTQPFEWPICVNSRGHGIDDARDLVWLE